MDHPGSGPNDLSVRLKWPQPDAVDDPNAVDDDYAPAPGGANGDRASRRAMASLLEQIPDQPDDSLHAALTAIAMRIDLLAKNSTTFTSVSDRLARAVEQMQAEMASLSEHLAIVEAAVSQVGANAEDAIVAALDDILARLDRADSTGGDEVRVALAGLDKRFSGLNAARQQGMAEVMARLDKLIDTRPGKKSSAAAGDERQLMQRIEQLSEQVEALRRRIPVRAKPAAGALDESAVADLADAIAAALAARTAGPPHRGPANQATTKAPRPLRGKDPAAGPGGAPSTARRRGRRK